MSDALPFLTVASGLRTHEVAGDTMAPLFRRGDVVVFAPVHAYQGEGHYILDDGAGGFEIFTCQWAGALMPRGTVMLMSANKAYPTQLIAADDFGAFVVGKIGGVFHPIERAVIDEAFASRPVAIARDGDR